MINIMGKVLGVIETILVVIIIMTIFVISYNFVQLRILQKDFVPIFNYAVFEVVSDSMAPVISKNDVVVVNTRLEISKDDIITYRLEDAFITHRVLEAHENYYLTKGDNNNVADALVNKESVVGKVVKTLPALGVWRKVLLDPIVLAATIGVLAAMHYIVFKNNGNSMRKSKKYKKDYRITHRNIIEEAYDKK